MSEKGKIYSYTVIHSPMEEFMDKVPYLVGLVEYDGARYFSLIEGYEESRNVSIGMDVEVVKRDESGELVFSL